VDSSAADVRSGRPLRAITWCTTIVSDLHEHMLPLVSSSSHYGAQSARQLSPPGQTNRVVVHMHLFIRLFIIALQRKTTMRYTWLFMTEERTCRQVELCLGKAIVPHKLAAVSATPEPSAAAACVFCCRCGARVLTVCQAPHDAHTSATSSTSTQRSHCSGRRTIHMPLTPRTIMPLLCLQLLPGQQPAPPCTPPCAPPPSAPSGRFWSSSVPHGSLYTPGSSSPPR
jgi:hypothetical protein